MKAAVVLATTLKLEASYSGTSKADLCKRLDEAGGGKPITLIYEKGIQRTDSEKSDIEIPISAQSKALYEYLLPEDQGGSPRLPEIPSFKLDIGPFRENMTTPEVNGDSHRGPFLTIQKVGFVDLVVRSDDGTLASTRVVVPGKRSETTLLPLPKPACFGKQTFTLALSNAGAVTNIGYSKEPGGAAALNALSTIAQTQTAAARAAELEAEADLIAQQQRLVLCQTKPEECEP